MIFLTVNRNACPNVAAPTRKWESRSFPEQSEITLGDDVQRIHFIRNDLCHKVRDDIPVEKFVKELDQVCRRMDILFPEEKILEKLDGHLQHCLCAPELMKEVHDMEARLETRNKRIEAQNVKILHELQSKKSKL